MTIDEARHLLAKADLFFDDPYNPDPESALEDRQTLNMNDTWGWATGWGVYVPDDQLPRLASLFYKYGRCGVLYWVSSTNDNLKSEFHHINRMVEFVKKEEEIRESCKTLSEYAYKKASYCVRGK